MNRAPSTLALVAGSAIVLMTASARAGDGVDDAQDVIFLGEARPVFLRFRIESGDRGFRAAWLDSVGDLHKDLDRDGDGRVTREEFDRGSMPTLVRAATGGDAALPHTDVDTGPRDGTISTDELAEVLRAALGPFRVDVGRVASRRNDALFAHVDRDDDGALSREELGAAVASLHRFDLDDDELIDRAELEPFSNPIAMSDDEQPRHGRRAPLPPVIELSAGDPSFKPVRLLLKKYDNGAGEGGSAGDNRLTPGEFAIDPEAFAAADADRDGTLDTEELRRFLGRVEAELELVVRLPGRGGKKPATIAARRIKGRLPKEAHVETISDGHLELSIGDIRLEFLADGGEHDAENARAYYANQFRAADADKNQYLEKSEIKDHGPFVTLFDAMDRDGDGKLTMQEVEAFVDRQSAAARSQLVLTVADHGRSIFSIVDQDRDRTLGVREIRGAAARAASWDRDGDGRVRSDEIPHHFQMTIGHGQVVAAGMPRFGSPAMNVPAARPPDGPRWFRKMDRNRDGDVSRREFLGPLDEFDRLDADRDGLLDAAEASKAGAKSGPASAR